MNSREQFCLYLPAALVAQIRSISSKTDVPMTKIIQRMIEECLKKSGHE